MQAHTCESSAGVEGGGADSEVLMLGRKPFSN